MNSDAFLQPYMIPGESLRWSASIQVPFWKKLRPLFPAAGIFLAIFSLMLLGILSSANPQEKPELPPPITSIAAETTPVKPDQSRPDSLASAIMMALFISSFLTIWGAVMYNGFLREVLKDRFTHAQSHYGLTQYRLIWINGEKKRRVYSYLLINMEHFRLDEREDRTGDIYITLKPHGPHHPFQPPLYKPMQPVLLTIPDAAQVYNLIFQAKLEAKP